MTQVHILAQAFAEYLSPILHSTILGLIICVLFSLIHLNVDMNIIAATQLVLACMFGLLFVWLLGNAVLGYVESTRDVIDGYLKCEIGRASCRERV